LQGCIVWAALASEVFATISPNPAVPDSAPESSEDSSASRHQDAAKSLAKEPASGAEGEKESKKLPDAASLKTSTPSPQAESKPEEKSSDKKAASESDASATASLQAQIDALSKEKSKLEDEVKSLAAKNDEISKEKTKLEGDVASMDATNAELRKSLNSQTDTHSKTVEELSQAQVSLTAAQKELSQTKDALEKSKKQEDQLQVDLKRVAGQLETSVSEHKETREELTRTKSARDAVTDERDKTAKQLEDLKKEKEALQKEHERLHGDHATLAAQYADPSVQHFLRAKAVKVYKDPGIQGAKNKTFIYVLPSLQKRYAQGRDFVKNSDAIVYSKLNAYVGTEKVEPWLPAISGALVYGTIIIPFICTVCVLTRIVCKVRPLLLFCHLDFLLTTLCAGIFALYTGKEPLAAFAHHDASVYLFTQVIFGLAYCMYFLLLCCMWCCSKRGTMEGAIRFCQIVGAAPIFGIYYKLVWTPAMLDEMPRMDILVEWIVGPGAAVSQFAWLPYFPVSVLFLILLRLERACWQASGSDSKKKEELCSVVMRDDIELATIYGEGSSDSSAAKKE
jgi:predicted  nucleic acid-binding Zn-ribbon protein